MASGAAVRRRYDDRIPSRIGQEARALVGADPQRALRRAQDAYDEWLDARRLSHRERRRARRMRVEFEVFKAELEAIGIEVIMTSPSNVTHPATGGRTSDHHDRRQ
jgi:hypothetical protein